MKRAFYSIIITLAFWSELSLAKAYIGGGYGLCSYTSDITSKYQLKNSGKCPSFVLGYKSGPVSLEGFYQKFDSSGKVSHENIEYDLQENAKAYGVAGRLSFGIPYIRIGYASYKLDQSISLDGNEQNSAAMKKIYNIKESGTRDHGPLAGAGLQLTFGPVKTYIEYDYFSLQQSKAYYQSVSIGLLFYFDPNFLILEK